MFRTGTAPHGFTLIELSIVLVIIGLIAGGVLVGQDLIRAAGVRAQISQIEKYNTAVNTFRGKYDALPGDLNASVAAQFGFAARGQYPGEGDGDGLLEGNENGIMSTQPAAGYMQGTGETAMFWVDLSTADLIDGHFSTASSSVPISTDVTSSSIGLYFPPAKIGQGAYIYVYSNNGSNYFGLLAVTSIKAEGAGGGSLTSTGMDGFGGGLTVNQAYAIDTKIDDSLPQSGNVTAQYVSPSGQVCWSGPNSANRCNNSTPFTAATPGTVAGVSYGTCFNNGNVNGAAQLYSINIDNGGDFACALSFRFQ